MKIKLPSIIALILTLSACGVPPRSPVFNSDSTDNTLAEASYSVSRSISSLSEAAQAAHPLPSLEPPAPPASYGMGQLTSVDWSGPAEPLVRQLAKAAGYRVNVIGAPPAIPVLVTIYDQNRMLGDVLRDVGFQCARRAQVIVFPENRVLELRYAQN